MKNLEFDLSEKSIDMLCKGLNRLKSDFSRMATEITNESLKQLKNSAKDNVSRTVGKTGYPVTGQLANSFVIEKVDKHTGILANTDPNSAAVEFGTGIRGSTNPHPVAGEKDYGYNINGYTDGWWYYDESQNKLFHTYGQIAHRFMYDAIIDLKTSGVLAEIGKKAFDKIFGG